MLKICSIQSRCKTSEPNLFLTLNSQEAVSLFIDDAKSNTVRNFNDQSVTATNLCIDDIKKSEPIIKPSRNKGNSSVKKLGTTLFNLFHHQRKAQSKKTGFEYSSIKQKIKQSSSKLLKSKHKVTHSQLLEARSIQLQEELRQLHTKRQDEKMEKNLQHMMNSSKKSVQSVQKIQINRLSSVPDFIVNQSSKNIHRRLQSENKSQKIPKERNDFYSKLKNKLKNEIQKIQAKKNNGKENMLVQGCKMLKFDPAIQIRRKPLTDRPRPQSSLSRTGLEFQSSQFSDRDRRPKSSRSRTVERKEIQYMSANADNIFKKKPTSRPRTCKSSQNRREQYNFQSTMNKTINYVSPLYLAQSRSTNKKKVRNEKIKEKMLTLLVECDNQTNQYSQLDSGLKVFASYTDRMNKGLTQVSKMLEEAQINHDEYAQFLEK